MTIIHEIADIMQEVLTISADNAATESGFVKRQSKISGSVFVQSLVFGFLANADATVNELAQTADTLGTSVTDSGLFQRCTETGAECLRLVLKEAVTHMLDADPTTVPVLRRFTDVFIRDSSTVTLPAALEKVWKGCGGLPDTGLSAMKIQLQFSLLTGNLTSFELQNGRDSDRASITDSEKLIAGALYLQDLGYFKLSHLQEIADAKAFWISRMPAGVVVCDENGRRWNEVTDLLDDHWDGTPVDIPVTVGVRDRVPARLVGVRAPQEVVDQRRKRLRTSERKKGRTPSTRQLAMCAWTIFITNVPATLLSVPEVMVLARARWQIELLFKLWKSHGKIDESRSTKPYRVLCDVYAKLIGMVVQQWVFLIDLWSYPDRSLMKAAKTIQKQALRVAVVLGQRDALIQVLTELSTTITGCRIDQRKQKPSTYQLLLQASLLDVGV